MKKDYPFGKGTKHRARQLLLPDELISSKSEVGDVNIAQIHPGLQKDSNIEDGDFF